MHAKTIAIALSLLTTLTLGACGPDRREGDGDGGTGQQDAPCNTSISGKVYAPNGTLPLYNVTVYVPGSPPGPFTDGVQCGNCAASGDLPGGALTRTTSGPDGSFRLDNVPPGFNVSVILTSGKWRRIVNVPVASACGENVMPDGTFRMPRNKNEGDLPRIAMVTGGCDPLACILTKIGIDPNEFGDASSSDKRVVWYQGLGGSSSPGAPQPATALWNNLDEMRKFDMIINSCECSEENTEKSAPDLLRQYADIGGRVFGSHYHYTWTKNLIPQWQATATWTGGSTSTPDLVDTTHPRGAAFAEWLFNVQASSVMGQITLGEKIRNVSTVAPTTTRWLYSSGSPATTHYMSFDTPVGVEPAQQCGRVVYAGMHVASGSVNASFPSGCTAGLSPDEKALVFLLFDLGSCTGIIQ